MSWESYRVCLIVAGVSDFQVVSLKRLTIKNRELYFIMGYQEDGEVTIAIEGRRIYF